MSRRAVDRSGAVIGVAIVCLACLSMPAWAAEIGRLPTITPIVVETAKSATLPELASRLQAERLVYVGETHTAYADHLLQLEVLRSMAGRPGPLAVGVEWFQARFQPVLDDYLAGRIDEAEFLQRSEYYSRWRFDYRMYRPIVQFAKERGIPIIALNASQELIGGIRRAGINGLPADLRAELPDGYDFSDRNYEGMLRELFGDHEPSGRDFQRFLEVQLTWDESMAQRAAAYLTADAANRLLVLAGRGHIAGRGGIPDRVARRTGIRGVTIATFDSASSHFNAADLLVLANDRELPAAGRMKILLDDREDGVFVEGFGEDSPAEAAGVRRDDQITQIDGQTVRHFADIKIRMQDKAPGDLVELGLRRPALLLGDRELSVRFALVADSAPH